MIDKFKPFECKKCGKCCRNIVINIGYKDILRWLHEERYDILDQVSYIDHYKMGNGFYFEKSARKPKQPCPFLKENKCSIYESRPDACKDFPDGHSIWKSCPAWKEIEFRVDLLESTEASNKQAEDFRLAEDKKHLLLHFLYLARARKTAEIKKLLDPLDPDETLWCNSFDNNTRGWTETGANPYLSDSDTNYIDSAVKKAEHKWFGFANTAQSSNELVSVVLYLEGSGNGTDTQDVYLHDGTSEVATPYGFVFGSMGYQNVDVSSFIDTWTKVDACTMRIVHENAENACTIRRAYLFCTYSIIQDGTDDLSSSFTVAMTEATDDLSSSFTIQKSSEDDLSSSFEIQKSAETDLSSSFEILKSSTTDLSSTFTIRKTDTDDLSSQFTIRKEAEQDLSSSFTVVIISEVDLSSAFTIKNTDTADLSSSFTVPQPFFIRSVTCSPDEVLRSGPGTTELRCDWHDDQDLNATEYECDLYTRAPDSTIYGPFTGSVTKEGTEEYNATYNWNPPDDAPTGYYDLKAVVRRK